MMSEPRFVYASCKTRERAEAILEDMFASGEVCEGERPLIERKGKRWCITLPM